MGYVLGLLLLSPATERTCKPYMILDPLSVLFHSSTSLQVLSGPAPISLGSANCPFHCGGRRKKEKQATKPNAKRPVERKRPAKKRQNE